MRSISAFSGVLDDRVRGRAAGDEHRLRADDLPIGLRDEILELLPSRALHAFVKIRHRDAHHVGGRDELHGVQHMQARAKRSRQRAGVDECGVGPLTEVGGDEHVLDVDHDVLRPVLCKRRALLDN